MKIERIIINFMVIIIYLKLLNFLSLVEKISPLIDIIRKIYSDIKNFMIVLIGLQLFISSCFFIIGKNQK